MSQSSVLPATLTGQKEAKQNKIWFQTSTNIYSLEGNSMQSDVAVQQHTNVHGTVGIGNPAREVKEDFSEEVIELTFNIA